MKTLFKQTPAVGIALALTTVAVNANTVSFATVTETDSFGPTVTSNTAADGTATATGSTGSFATQNADGTSEVEAATGNAFGDAVKSVAEAVFEQSETNTSGMSRDYTLSYDLTGQTAVFNTGFVQATAFTAFGLAAPAVPSVVPTNPLNPFLSDDDALPANFTQFSGASFEYRIEVNGTQIFNARADALLNGFSPFGGPIIDVESGFVASTSTTATGFSFSVAGISGDIFLGSFADDDEIDVVSYLTARAYTPGGAFDGFAIGVNSFSSDPISLSSVGSLSSVATPTTGNPSPVPLPAAGWLLIAGLGGLAATRRRKS